MVNGLAFQLREARTMGINGIWDLPCLSDDAEENLTLEYDFTPSPDDYPPEFAELKVALTTEENCFFQLKKNVGKFSLTRIAIPGGIEFDEKKEGSSVMTKVLVCILTVSTILGICGSYHFRDELKSKEGELATTTNKLNEANKKICDLEKQIAIQRAPEEINETLVKIYDNLVKIKTLSNELEDLSKKLPDQLEKLEQLRKVCKPN